MNEDIRIQIVGRLADKKFGKEQNSRIYSIEGLSPTCQTCQGGHRETKILLGWSRDNKGNIVNRHPVEVANTLTVAKRDTTQNYVLELKDSDMEIKEPQTLTKQRTEEGKELRRQGIDVYANRELTPRVDGVSGTLTTVLKDNYVIEPNNDIEMETEQNPKIVARPHGYFPGAEYEECSPTVKSSAFAENNHLAESEYRIRKLTPKECFRLMGVDDENIDKLLSCGVSNSQLYKLAGNSIVVDVLEHIFRKLLIDKEPDKTVQLTLEL